MNYFIDHYNKNSKFILDLQQKNHICRQKAENIKQKQTPKQQHILMERNQIKTKSKHKLWY